MFVYFQRLTVMYVRAIVKTVDVGRCCREISICQECFNFFLDDLTRTNKCIKALCFYF